MFGLSGFFRKNYFPAASLLLIIVFAFLMLSTAFSTSALWDEPVTLAIGYYTLKTSDFRLNYHPPLGFELISLPLLFIEPQPQIPPNAASYPDYSYLAFVPVFFSSVKDVSAAVFAGRLVPMLFALLLAVLVLFWASRLYGKVAGLLALAVFVFNPAVLGNTPVATNDVPATFFIVLALFLFWQFTASPSLRKLLLLAVVFTLAVLSKFTALFLLPIFFVLWLFFWSHFKSFPAHLPFFTDFFSTKHAIVRKLYQFGMLLLVFSVVFVILGVVFYRGQFGTVGESLPKRHLERALSFAQALPQPVSGFATAALTKIPVPFPSFFASVAEITGISLLSGKSSFLFGEIYEGGRWQYFFVEFFLKTPLPILILLLLAFVSLRKLRFMKPSELFLLLPAAIYLALFLPNNENFGIRHLFPIYPLISIFSARTVRAFWGRRKLLLSVLLPLLFWLVFSVVSIHPNHFSYFNELGGGSDNGYGIMPLNVDQGQGLKALEHHMKGNMISSVKLSYFGSIDPALYGINYTYLPSPYWQPWVPGYAPSKDLLPHNYSEDCRQTTGAIAVSATNLQNVYLLNKTCFDWLKEYTPVAKAGYSIFIYNITTLI